MASVDFLKFHGLEPDLGLGLNVFADKTNLYYSVSANGDTALISTDLTGTKFDGLTPVDLDAIADGMLLVTDTLAVSAGDFLDLETQGLPVKLANTGGVFLKIDLNSALDPGDLPEGEDWDTALGDIAAQMTHAVVDGYPASILMSLPVDSIMEHMIGDLDTDLTTYQTAMGAAADAAEEAAASDDFAAALVANMSGNYTEAMDAVEIRAVAFIDTGVAFDDVKPEVSGEFHREILVAQDGGTWLRVVTFNDPGQLLEGLVDDPSGSPTLYDGPAGGEALTDIRVMEYGPGLNDGMTLAEIEAATRSVSDANTDGVADMATIGLDAFSYLAGGHSPYGMLPFPPYEIDSTQVGNFVLLEDRNDVTNGAGYDIGFLPKLKFNADAYVTINLIPGDHGEELDLRYIEGNPGVDVTVHLHSDTSVNVEDIKPYVMYNHASTTITWNDGVEPTLDIDGSDTADTIEVPGGAFEAYVYGGGGNDELIGSDGMDTLAGEDGDDTLTGGLGDDTFEFTWAYGQNEGNDRITDLQPGDTLEFIIDTTDDAVSNPSSYFWKLGDKGMTIDHDGNPDTAEVALIGVTTHDVTGETIVSYGVDHEAGAQASVTLSGPPVAIEETGERWGNYIKYGVYATDDIETSNLDITLSWLDADYSMVEGSAALGNMLPGSATFNESFRQLSETDSYSSFNFAEGSSNPVQISAGDLLYEFMLERITPVSKDDFMYIENADLGYMGWQDLEYYFSFASDEVAMDIETHSGTTVPNGKFFRTDGSVMDGLVIVPKATQYYPEYDESVIEYDIELRVSQPLLDVPLTLADEYVVRIGGGVDFNSIYNNLDTAGLPAGVTTADIKFYVVDETSISSGDAWADIKTGATEITAKDQSSLSAWSKFGDDLAEGNEALYVTFDTSKLETAPGTFAGDLSDGSFTLASFMSSTDHAAGVDFDGKETHLALTYQEVGSSADLDYDLFDGSQITLKWEEIGNSKIHDRSIPDGSEVYVLGDKFYANPIGEARAITAYDATLTLDIAAQVDPGSVDNSSFIAADFNQDGTVDNMDAQQILKYSAHLKQWDDGGVSKAVSIPQWYYIDNVNNDNHTGGFASYLIGSSHDIADRNGVTFDTKIDYFVGSNRFIDATAVLVGDVSSNYVAVSDSYNPVYHDAFNYGVITGTAPGPGAPGTAPGGGGGMETVVITWALSSTDDADAIMVDNVAQHLDAGVGDVDVNSAITTGDDTWTATTNDAGMLVLARTPVNAVDETPVTIEQIRDAAVLVAEAANTASTNEQFFIGYADATAGKTYVWDIQETETPGDFVVDTEYQITGVATALNTSSNADGTIYLDGYTPVSGSATLAAEETYVLSDGVNDSLAVTSALSTGSSPAVILNFDKINDSLDLSSLSLQSLQVGAVVESATIAEIADSIGAKKIEVNNDTGTDPWPTPSALTPIVVLANITDTDPVEAGDQGGQSVLIDITGGETYALALGFDAGTFTSVAEVITAIDLTA